MLSLGTRSLLIFVSDTENAAAYAQINTQQIHITSHSSVTRRCHYLQHIVTVFCNTVQMTETLYSESHHKSLTDYFCNHPYTSNNEIQKQQSFSLVNL